MKRYISTPKHFCMPPNWITTFVGFASMLAGFCYVAHAQPQPAKSHDYEMRVDRILENISNGELGLGHASFRRNAMFLEAHARYHDALVQDRKEKRNKTVAIHNELFERYAQSEFSGTEFTGSDGVVAGNLETTELLLRECLLERQRLEWESATEEMAPDIQFQLSEQQASIARLKFKNKQIVLEGLQQQLDIAKESLQRASERRKTGTIPASEYDEAAMRFAEIQSAADQTAIDIKTIVEESKLKQDSDTQLLAERQARLHRRKDVLHKQIEQLKADRLRARKAELVLEEVARQRKTIAEMSEEITKLELRASESRTLLKFIQDALQSSENKDAPQENAADKK